jgi:hypothetical protein
MAVRSMARRRSPEIGEPLIDHLHRHRPRRESLATGDLATELGDKPLEPFVADRAGRSVRLGKRRGR